jgi:DNA-binding GntR family transcriptional regulator
MGAKACHKRRAGDLADRGYREIRDAIIDLTFQPGQPLQEKFLSEWLGFSRTPVREALRRLQAEGLIESVSSRGLVVAELSVDDVDDSYLVIEVMEGLASKLAADRITDGGRDDIRQILERMRQAAGDANVVDWTQADADLHEEVRRIAANPRIDRVLRSVYPVIERVRNTYLREGSEPDRLSTATETHCQMAEAIMQGDGAVAEHLTRQLFAKAREDNVRLLRHWVAPLRRSF